MPAPAATSLVLGHPQRRGRSGAPGRVSGPGVAGPGQRCRFRSLRFLIRLPQVAMSHQAPTRLWERS